MSGKLQSRHEVKDRKQVADIFNFYSGRYSPLPTKTLKWGRGDIPQTVEGSPPKSIF